MTRVFHERDIAYEAENKEKCPPDSVEVGPLCVDKYEARMWETTNKAIIKKIKKGKIKLADNLAGKATRRGIIQTITMKRAARIMAMDAQMFMPYLFPE